MTQPLRAILIGGGPGSFMGPVHHRAVQLTGLAELAGGFFSRDAAKNAAMAETLRLPPGNVLPDMDALMAALPRIAPDFAIVITPTPAHFSAVSRLLRAGVPVVCDKPLCSTLEDAEAVAELSAALDLPVMVTYTYAGYAMPAEARARVLAGELGTLRMVTAEYLQDSFARRPPHAGTPRGWRYDAAHAKSFCVEDIGVHLEHMVRYITGQRLREVAARLHRFTPGALMDDNAFIWATLGADGDSGTSASAAADETKARTPRVEVSAVCSKVAVGMGNRLSIRVTGDKGALAWQHVEPEILRLYPLNQPETILRRGDPGLSEAARARSTVPVEHPQGYTEAFSALYTSFCRHLLARKRGESPVPDFPTAYDGMLGIRFVHACLSSHEGGGEKVALYI